MGWGGWEGGDDWNEGGDERAERDDEGCRDRKQSARFQSEGFPFAIILIAAESSTDEAHGDTIQQWHRGLIKPQTRQRRVASARSPVGDEQRKQFSWPSGFQSLCRSEKHTCVV